MLVRAVRGAVGDEVSCLLVIEELAQLSDFSLRNGTASSRATTKPYQRDVKVRPSQNSRGGIGAPSRVGEAMPSGITLMVPQARVPSSVCT